jgi:uncharacterized delta-60 repeat protein
MFFGGGSEDSDDTESGSSEQEVATSLAPDNGTDITDTTPELTWAAVPDATGYEVQLTRTEDDFSGAETAETDTESYTPAGPLANTAIHYWRVRPLFPGGVIGEWSVAASFFLDWGRVGEVFPANDSTVDDSTLFRSWNAVDNAVEYQVQVAGSAAAVPEASATTITSLSYSYPSELNDGETIYWRVRAVDGESTVAPWSDVSSVTYSSVVEITGALDTSFNSGDTPGYFVGPEGAGGGSLEEYARDVVLRSDGAYLATGRAATIGNVDRMIVWCITSAGALCTDFNGTTGYVLPSSDNSKIGYAIDIASDNSIYVMGRSWPDNRELTVWKVLADGTGLDTNWAGAGNGEKVFSLSTWTDVAYDGLIDGDGMLLMTGKRDGNTNTVVKRYDPTNETNDSAFNGGSDVIFPNVYSATTYESGNSVVVDGQGRIIIAGKADNGTPAAMAVWRMTSTGSLDTNFSSNGEFVEDDPLGEGVTNRDKEAEGVALDTVSAGMYVAGWANNANSDKDMVLFKLTGSGALDSAFGGDGIVTWDNPDATSADKDQAFDVAVQADGKPIVVGTSYTDSENDLDFTAWRFNTDGSLDSSFSTDGRFAIDFGGPEENFNNDTAYRVRIENGDRLVIVGAAKSGNPQDMVLVRLE